MSLSLVFIIIIIIIIIILYSVCCCVVLSIHIWSLHEAFRVSPSVAVAFLYKLNCYGSNNDDSFTVADLNPFLSP